jgi:sugar (pentulose or hexulose) kinase
MLGIVGWLPLGVSLIAALGDSSNAAIAIPLVVAGVVASSGTVLAVRAIPSEASSLAAVTSGLAIVLNVALLIAATLLAVSVHWQ